MYTYFEVYVSPPFACRLGSICSATMRLSVHTSELLLLSLSVHEYCIIIAIILSLINTKNWIAEHIFHASLKKASHSTAKITDHFYFVSVLWCTAPSYLYRSHLSSLYMHLSQNQPASEERNSTFNTRGSLKDYSFHILLMACAAGTKTCVDVWRYYVEWQNYTPRRKKRAIYASYRKLFGPRKLKMQFTYALQRCAFMRCASKTTNV